MSEFRAIPSELLEGPVRPEKHHGARFAQGQGDYVSETTAARKNDALINREYYAFENSAQKALEKHIEKTQTPAADRGAAREALLQHLEGAKREVTNREVAPAIER